MKRTSILFPAIVGLLVIPGLVGCSSTASADTDPVKLISDDSLFSDEVKPEVLTGDAEFNKVTEIIDTTKAEELSFLINFDWYEIEHYEHTKIFLLEGPASSKQKSTTESLIEQLEFSEWMLVEDNSTSNIVDIAYWSEHGRLSIISNDVQTGINLQYENL